MSIALERETGKRLWEYPNTLGNVTVGNSIVYVMTSDTQVVALDIKTGEQLGKIDFTPDLIQPRQYNKFYLSANDDGGLLVYLGESNQLFAFRFLPLR